ncbi:sigma factor-like helix-turn-helix DNA-binding protein [Kineococcus sp. DHX-1]|uniref:sigma factor-like helix-turn-helix DNA-binding protein n=1 Tax=Kineococcus sp. DHX-1 TaxID=3349638 RepID=UPI0036D311F0
MSTPHDGVIASLDLAAAWHRLAPGEQEVLALAVFEDLTSAQAALVLGTTATAHRLRLTRARRALRAHLDDADAADPVEARHEHPLTDETLEATR